MDPNELQRMLTLCREMGNFNELKRLEKIAKFQNPDFKYPKKSEKKIRPKALSKVWNRPQFGRRF